MRERDMLSEGATVGEAQAGWAGVDEGWGHDAPDVTSLSEPSKRRADVARHHHLGISAGERLLDVAGGSGLAVELATLQGASCAGIDASTRLIDVAQDRSPSTDLRVGEDEFTRVAVDYPSERIRNGLPLRAEIEVVGYFADQPTMVGA
jgi:hypothetical protein